MNHYPNTGATLESTVADYQSLNDKVNTKRKVGSTFIGATVTPAGSSAAWTGQVARWLEINEAVKGLGATPITGFDSVITSHTADINDGSNNLAASYDSGDHIHPNIAGLMKIATRYAALLPTTK